MLNGISKTLKCVLGLWLGCAILPAASAQVVMMGGNSFQGGAVSYGAVHMGASQAAAVSIGQPRVVGFQPIGAGSNFGFSNGMNMNMSGFAGRQAPVTFGRLGGLPAGAVFSSNGLTSASPVTSVSGYGRIVRYRYRVPVYGHVKTQSSCGPCGN